MSAHVWLRRVPHGPRTVLYGAARTTYSALRCRKDYLRCFTESHAYIGPFVVRYSHGVRIVRNVRSAPLQALGIGRGRADGQRGLDFITKGGVDDLTFQ